MIGGHASADTGESRASGCTAPQIFSAALVDEWRAPTPPVTTCPSPPITASRALSSGRLKPA
eukprot:16411118-Heterocapsa_arctica.AAC.1